MRKMESYTYKRWTKMWRLWKHHRLESPLEELVTYDNYMTHGHFCYFQYLKNDIEIKRNIWILKKYLSKEMYENLETAYQIYKDNINLINSNKINGMELEEIFLLVDENFYQDAYELTKIIMIELSDYTNIKIAHIKFKWKIHKFFKSNRKS